MNEAFELSSGACDVGTIDRSFFLVALDRRSARRALARHPPWTAARLTLLGNRRDDLRDHFAGALYLNDVADPKILSPHEVFVMKRCQLDDDATDLDRVQNSVRVYRPCTADVDANVEQLRLGDIRRELACDCPAGLASTDHAELVLKGETVDLHDAAVDREVERPPYSVLDLVRPFVNLLQVFTPCSIRRNGNSPGSQLLEQLPLRAEWQQ